MVEPTQQPEEVEVETVAEEEEPETVVEPTEESSQVNVSSLLKKQHTFKMHGIVRT